MRRSQSTISFEVCRDQLVRQVLFADGRGYTQICKLAVFEQVAGLIEERGNQGVTTNELWEALPDLPCTQISVALAFLKERGCVEVNRRRAYPATGTLYEDALTEYHALAHAATNPGRSDG